MIQGFFFAVGGVIGAANSGLFVILHKLLLEAGIAETVFTHVAYKSAISVDLIALERVLKMGGFCSWDFDCGRGGEAGASSLWAATVEATVLKL